jgi:hypothetical protein
VGLNLLLSVAMLDRWQVGPITVGTVKRRLSLVATMILNSNGIGDVTSASCYCDRPGPIVSDLN